MIRFGQQFCSFVEIINLFEVIRKHFVQFQRLHLESKVVYNLLVMHNIKCSCCPQYQGEWKWLRYKASGVTYIWICYLTINYFVTKKRTSTNRIEYRLLWEKLVDVEYCFSYFPYLSSFLFILFIMVMCYGNLLRKVSVFLCELVLESF